MNLEWFRLRPQPDEVPPFHYFRGDPAKLCFANRAELEYARRFDSDSTPWDYEPRTFVLARGAGGRVTEAFTPDFYLPEQKLYIEVTLMKQSLVTRKNRKLRKLKEQYPWVQAKICYARDFEAEFAELVHQHQPPTLPPEVEAPDPLGLSVSTA